MDGLVFLVVFLGSIASRLKADMERYVVVLLTLLHTIMIKGSSGLPSLSLKSYPSPPAFEKIIRVQAGYHLGLECEVGGGGQSSAITWFRDGTEFSTDSIRQSRDTLQFDNVTKMADGVYKCCLDNEKYCSNEIEVKVTDKPILIPGWGNQHVCHINPGTRNFSLSADIIFDGNVICQWKKDGKSIKFDNKCVVKGRRTLTLHFDEIQDSDSGTYAVVIWTAFNPAITESLTLIVQGPPVAPTLPNVSFVEQTTVVVTIPANISAGYLIQYGLVGSRKWMMVNVSADFVGETVNITGLNSCSEYEIRLVAYNEDGASPHSPSVKVEIPSLHSDQVQFYAFQDMLLVLHQDHFVRGCFPLHTQATMFGSYICNSSQNLNGTEEGLNYSTLNSTILQFLPSCDKAATCTTMCSSLVRACPHGQMTLSRQDICPVTINPTQELGNSDNKSSGNPVAIVVVVISVIVIIAILALVLWHYKRRRGSRHYSLAINGDRDHTPTDSSQGKDTELVDYRADRDTGVEEIGSLKDTPITVGSSALSETDGHPSVDKDEDNLLDESEVIDCLGNETHIGLPPVDMTRVPDRTQLTAGVHILTTDGNDEENRQPEATSPVNTTLIQTSNAVNSNGAKLPASHMMNKMHRTQGKSLTSGFEESQSQPSSHSRWYPLRSLSSNDVQELSRGDRTGSMLHGLHQGIVMLHSVVGEVAVEVAQTNATLNRVELNQQKDSDRTKVIEATTTQNRGMLSDMASLSS